MSLLKPSYIYDNNNLDEKYKNFFSKEDDNKVDSSQPFESDIQNKRKMTFADTFSDEGLETMNNEEVNGEEVDNEEENYNENEEEGIDYGDKNNDETLDNENTEFVNEKDPFLNDDILLEDLSMEVLGNDNKNISVDEVHFQIDSFIHSKIVFSSDIIENSVDVNEALCLSDFMKSKLQEENIDKLFPVQIETIPILLNNNNNSNNNDVCLCAPTGSGKTLAYLIPIIEQALTHKYHPQFFSLIIVPTIDLSIQIKNLLDRLISNTMIKVMLLSPSTKLEQEKQALIYKNLDSYMINCDILITTPGRLVEHLKSTDHLDLSNLKTLILDEADRLLDTNFDNWLTLLYSNIKKGLDRYGIKFGLPTSIDEMNNGYSVIRKFLVSASISLNPRHLVPLNLCKTVLIHSQVETLCSSKSLLLIPKQLKEFIIKCDVRMKPLVLNEVLNSLNTRFYEHNEINSIILCFANTIETVERLCFILKKCPILNEQCLILEFTSKITVKDRLKITKMLESKIYDRPVIIITTDVMSRGIDFQNIRSVINYDFPLNNKQYVHRIGRTARAALKGSAYTLLNDIEFDKYLPLLDNINRHQNLIIKTMTKEDISQNSLDNYSQNIKTLSKFVRKQKLCFNSISNKRYQH